MKNEKFSHKDFLNKSLLKESSKDFQGEIVGSCFYQEGDMKEIFPKDIKCTFIRCNLDNVIVPAGCEMIDCTNNNIVCKEGDDCVVDKTTKVTLSKISEVE